MTKTVAIVQSNYIPWKGYFDLINIADEFILYDDMQYTRRDWRNRNRIKTSHGLMWLTIPVKSKGNYYQPIKDVEISDTTCNSTHWQTILHSYAKAPYFSDYRAVFEELYSSAIDERLSVVNFRFISGICRILGITTNLTWSMDYELVEGKTERLVSLCEQAGATCYLSGPSAKGYMDEGLFEEKGIAVHYMEYVGYPEYPQVFPPFEHAVSVLDLIFNTGSNARNFMKSFD